jgi:hypothetical protein
MAATALAGRFAREVLAGIQANIPLEAETAARVGEALSIASTGSVG